MKFPVDFCHTFAGSPESAALVCSKTESNQLVRCGRLKEVRACVRELYLPSSLPRRAKRNRLDRKSLRCVL